MPFLCLFPEEFFDWFVPKSLVNNRTGRWFVGVASLGEKADVDKIVKDEKSCTENNLDRKQLADYFGATHYDMRTYIGGMYYYNERLGNWDGVGVDVRNQLLLPLFYYQ